MWPPVVVGVVVESRTAAVHEDRDYAGGVDYYLGAIVMLLIGFWRRLRLQLPLRQLVLLLLLMMMSYLAWPIYRLYPGASFGLGVS